MSADRVHVYIAGRSEDQALCQRLRARLAEHGIGCTASWLDKVIDNQANQKRAALMCMTDITRADVLVMLNPAKVHKSGTGGRHTEFGIAIHAGKGVVIVGARENVFHHLDLVRCVPPRPEGSIADIVAAVRELAAVAPRAGQ
jgi:hypothetical protein